jgi:hypothetical protein
MTNIDIKENNLYRLDTRLLDVLPTKLHIKNANVLIPKL